MAAPPAGADVVALIQPLKLMLVTDERIVVHAVAMASDGNQMHYLVVASSSEVGGQAPRWVAETEISKSWSSE